MHDSACLDAMRTNISPIAMGLMPPPGLLMGSSNDVSRMLRTQSGRLPVRMRVMNVAMYLRHVLSWEMTLM